MSNKKSKYPILQVDLRSIPLTLTPDYYARSVKVFVFSLHDQMVIPWPLFFSNHHFVFGDGLNSSSVFFLCIDGYLWFNMLLDIPADWFQIWWSSLFLLLLGEFFFHVWDNRFVSIRPYLLFWNGLIGWHVKCRDFKSMGYAIA